MGHTALKYFVRIVLAGTGILTVQLVFKLANVVYKKRKLQKALKDFPGPAPHWLYGNVKELSRGGEGLMKVLEFRQRYGPVFPLWIGPVSAAVQTTHPDYVKVILNTAEPKNPWTYNTLLDWIGDGLLISKGEKWKRNRRLLTPAFHFDILRPYIGVFSDCTNVMVQKWRRLLKDGESEPLEMFHHISLMTLDSLLKCVMGYHGPSVQNVGGKNKYIEAVYRLSELAITRVRTPYLQNELVWMLHPTGWQWRKYRDCAHQFTKNVIREKKKELEQATSENDLNKNSHKKRKCLDFIDMLLKARDADGQGLSDIEIQNEMDTFMFEGHDTTASGLSWCCYNLADNPEYQDKCREELNQVLGDRDELTWDDMAQLPYLTQCIKESLRLYPPVANVSRKITRPLPLPDGRTIPTDSWVNIGIWQVHHNEEVWEDPFRYDPERFSINNSSERSSFAFVPFAAGPRNCIGQQFAMNEMKTCMAIILKNFRLSTVPGKEPVPLAELILRSKDGVWLNIEDLS